MCKLGKKKYKKTTDYRYGVILRADEYNIRVGHNTVIGDNSTVSCSLNRLPTDVLPSVNIGKFDGGGNDDYFLG